MSKLQDAFKGDPILDMFDKRNNTIPTMECKPAARELKQHVGDMTAVHREEFISRIKGMSQEELEIVADLLPIEMCFNRIKKELDKSKQFEASIKAAMNGLN